MALALRYVYQPVADLDAAAALYETELGLHEVWNDGSTTRAYGLDGTDVQVMVAVTDEPAGPMFEVDDLAAWTGAHPHLDVVVPPSAIPGGAVTGFRSADGNTFSVFDQPSTPAG